MIVAIMFVIVFIGTATAWFGIEEPGKIIGLKSKNKETDVLLEHYTYIASIVEYHAEKYDLDYDNVLNFVLDKLSANNYKKITAFKRKSSFKTFITTVVARVIYTYGRRIGNREKKVEELPDQIPAPKVQNPLDFLIEIEEARHKEKALKYLPGILKSLAKQEQRVIRMKHEWELKISTISNTLRVSRYRVERILEGAEFKIKQQLDSCLAKHGGESNASYR